MVTNARTSAPKRSKPAATKKAPAPKKPAASPAPKKQAKPKASPTSKKRSKARKKPEPQRIDSEFVIVDDDIQFDAQREAEERRAYLEEARSQDAAD